MANITMSKQINGIVEANFLKDIEDAKEAIYESNGTTPANMTIVCSKCDSYYNSIEDNEPCVHLKKVLSNPR